MTNVRQEPMTDLEQMTQAEPSITISLSLLEDLTAAAQYAVVIADELLSVPDYESPDFDALMTLRGWAENAHSRGMDAQRQYHATAWHLETHAMKIKIDLDALTDSALVQIIDALLQWPDPQAVNIVNALHCWAQLVGLVGEERAYYMMAEEGWDAAELKDCFRRTA